MLRIRREALPYQTGAPWANGQVELTNRTIKIATIKRFRCNLNEHPQALLLAYNHAKR